MNQHRYVLPKRTLLIIGAVCVVALGFTSISPYRTTSTKQSFATSKMGGIIHIVMFEFKEEVTTQEVKDVCNRMLALKELCLHPATNKPYVKMAVGGKENSPEGISGGITHAFVVEFDNEEDRKYYLEKDPAHLAFVKSIGAVIKKAQVVDFTPGVF